MTSKKLADRLKQIVDELHKLQPTDPRYLELAREMDTLLDLDESVRDIQAEEEWERNRE